MAVVRSRQYLAEFLGAQEAAGSVIFLPDAEQGVFHIHASLLLFAAVVAAWGL
jgi:hypothetical protein